MTGPVAAGALPARPVPARRLAADTPPCLVRTPRTSARLRLVCFHHAGGGAAAFRGWADHLGADIDVVPVLLPGREARVREPVAQSMEALLTALDEQLGPYLDDPYVLYGHSMGALIAHDLATLRRRTGRRAPERLLVGACAAPTGRRDFFAEAAELPDSALVELLRAGGTSPVLLSHPDWLHWGLALLRADLRLCASRTASGVVPGVSCPVEVFAGLADELVAPAEAERWARVTSASCRTHWIPGGHFFFRDSGPQFFARLAAVLDEVLAVGGTVPARS